MKPKPLLLTISLITLSLLGVCCIGNLVISGIGFWQPRYKEGPGLAGKATEAQVVQAEFGFDLPPSASDVRLAIHGGKDYGLSGWMIVDPQELEPELIASGYEVRGQVGFRSWTEMYPKMTWMVLDDSEVQTSYSHPDHDGRVVISTRQVAGGQVEVLFQRWSGKRSQVTWQYFE